MPGVEIERPQDDGSNKFGGREGCFRYLWVCVWVCICECV